MVVGAIAAVELVALVAIGALDLVPPRHASPSTHARHLTAATRPATPVRRVALAPSHPLRARGSVSVLVLNGNGVRGAAATTAARLQHAGYRIGGAQNAQRHDYAQSMVMYVPGWVKEARRIAHETGVRLVAPVDGLAPARLKGSQIVVILGN